MKNYSQLLLRFLISLSIIFSISSYSSAQKINDLIHPIHLKAGNTDSVLVSDIFYSPKYNVQFSSNKYIEVKYDKPKNKLIFKTNKNFEGIDLLNFTYNKNDYVIPVISKIEPTHLFVYTTDKNPKKVNLFGTFNGWNRGNLPMKKAAPGKFELKIPIAPGRYQYKFFVDGKELIDPANPVKVPNGMGDYNSIVIIPPRHKDKTYLHILGDKINDKQTVLSFYYERENQAAPLKLSDVTAIINNEKISSNEIKLNKNQI